MRFNLHFSLSREHSPIARMYTIDNSAFHFSKRTGKLISLFAIQCNVFSLKYCRSSINQRVVTRVNQISKSRSLRTWNTRVFESFRHICTSVIGIRVRKRTPINNQARTEMIRKENEGKKKRNWLLTGWIFCKIVKTSRWLSIAAYMLCLLHRIKYKFAL